MGLALYRKIAVDGTEYLQGETDDVEIQLLFDNHTQHLILRHPFDISEYEKD